MKERALYLALVGLIAAAVLSQGFASVRVAEAVARADAADSAASVSLAIADSVAEANASLRVRSDSLARAYAADSVRWQSKAREDAARIAALSARASESAEALVATLDTAGTRLFATYRAETDSIIAAQAETIDDLRAERAMLWARIEAGDELAAGLAAEADALRGANVALRSSNDALRAGLRAARRESRLLKLGGAALVGIALYNGLVR